MPNTELPDDTRYRNLEINTNEVCVNRISNTSDNLDKEISEGNNRENVGEKKFVLVGESVLGVGGNSPDNINTQADHAVPKHGSTASGLAYPQPSNPGQGEAVSAMSTAAVLTTQKVIPPQRDSLGIGYDIIASNSFEQESNKDATIVCSDKQNFLIENISSECVSEKPAEVATNIHSPPTGQISLGREYEANNELPMAVSVPSLTPHTQHKLACDLLSDGDMASSTIVYMTTNDAKSADNTITHVMLLNVLIKIAF